MNTTTAMRQLAAQDVSLADIRDTIEAIRAESERDCWRALHALRNNAAFRECGMTEEHATLACSEACSDAEQRGREWQETRTDGAWKLYTDALTLRYKAEEVLRAARNAADAAEDASPFVRQWFANYPQGLWAKVAERLNLNANGEAFRFVMRELV